MLDALASWPAFLALLVIYGFAPGALLRLICLAYRRDDPRRYELRAELYAVPRPVSEHPLQGTEQSSHVSAAAQEGPPP